ncbi:hypothetical protein BDM02DRAFT_3185478 [Thelephora ganbajun]|uniref:Uncharacterized protein n=1 Tax=Thelephora ganbajun TaxID=370292 RepID=A0ACB6ZLE8_THEGA|nr:hypothetical protein BDM02DRAFT_3185478 [Thelephora ganbajun]
MPHLPEDGPKSHVLVAVHTTLTLYLINNAQRYVQRSPTNQQSMPVLTILFTLSLLSSAVMAETYCYYNTFGDVVCRDRLSIVARIGIAVASSFVVFAILAAFAIHRKRRIARANMTFVHAAQDQQQVYPNQYPPPPQGSSFGTPFEGNGQKVPQGYDPQQYNGQYDLQYNGQHNPQHNPLQYPPATYEQGNHNQPAPPYPGYAPPPPQH